MTPQEVADFLVSIGVKREDVYILGNFITVILPRAGHELTINVPRNAVQYPDEKGMMKRESLGDNWQETLKRIVQMTYFSAQKNSTVRPELLKTVYSRLVSMYLYKKLNSLVSKNYRGRFYIGTNVKVQDVLDVLDKHGVIYSDVREALGY